MTRLRQVHRQVGNAFQQARMYARFAGGLTSFLRKQTTVDEARNTIRSRLITREDNFLKILDRGIYGYPSSPYLALLKEAKVDVFHFTTLYPRVRRSC